MSDTAASLADLTSASRATPASTTAAVGPASRPARGCSSVTVSSEQPAPSASTKIHGDRRTATRGARPRPHADTRRGGMRPQFAVGRAARPVEAQRPALSRPLDLD